MVTTLEEDKRRHARALNVRVKGVPAGTSPKAGGKQLCRQMGVEVNAFVDVWHAGDDMTRERPPAKPSWQAGALKGTQIYTRYNLTPWRWSRGRLHEPSLLIPFDHCEYFMQVELK